MEHPLAGYMHPITSSEANAQAKAAAVATEHHEASAGPLGAMERIETYDKVVEVLHTCYDPEIPVDIYELGLIYEVKVEESGEVQVKMTLTAPNCPAAQSLPAEVKYKVEGVPKVTSANVEVVWDPPWDMSKMTEAARLQLGMF
ncbi:MAG TPA: SUF system Fe-S cluster assembly protein [Terriglobia bacterium]|nr:SUF system Fe-S cluster assembly protein [Terriglobia bacterium]